MVRNRVVQPVQSWRQNDILALLCSCSQRRSYFPLKSFLANKTLKEFRIALDAWQALDR